MNIRNIQKSGNAYYIYLPSEWCKQNNLKGKSKVTLESSTDGKLLISPTLHEQKDKTLTIQMPEEDLRLINKLIVACYINPVRSFKIKLQNEISSLDILDHKKLLSGIELVEFDEKQITCESSVFVEDPDILLKTMIRKITNMLKVKLENKELMERYEEEIDRSNMLINKSVVSSLMFKRNSKLKHIHLFYIIRISIYLERFADELRISRLNKKQVGFLLELIRDLEALIDKTTIENAIGFTKKVLAAGEKNEAIMRNLENTADMLLDLAISNEIERQ